MLSATSNQKNLLRWTAWFFLGNTLLFYLVGLRFTFFVGNWFHDIITPSSHVLLIIFLTSAFIGHFALLAFIPCLLLIPLCLLIKNRHSIFIFASIVASACVILLLIDTFIYAQYRFHISGVYLSMFFSAERKEIFDFTWIEYLLLASMMSVVLVIELVFAYLLWNKFILKKRAQGYGKWIAIFLGFCFYLSWSLIGFSSPYPSVRLFVDNARIFPFYNKLFGIVFLGKNGEINMYRAGTGYFAQPDQAYQTLNYPLHPIDSQHPHYNLVIIAIDTWRFDMLNSSITPNTYKFAQKATLFTDHYSGGNSTRPGIFTLFYGIPANYWTATIKQHVPPVLIAQLLKNNYAMSVFASAELKVPEFTQNVFYGIPNIRLTTIGKNPKIRDKVITDEFSQFINTHAHSKQPFFSFLFYDSAHTYCQAEYNEPFKPVSKTCNRFNMNDNNKVVYVNRYKNALYYIDQEIAKDLALLKSKDLLKNTVILITGDHGQEFNDNHLGYWGHASNYMEYQVRTPLLVYIPKEKPAVVNRQTSHFDVAPTLMASLFNSKNPPTDYSVGSSLFNDPPPPPYLVMGSYNDFGIVEATRITTIFPTGDYQITDLHGNALNNATLNVSIMQQVFRDLRRFYR